MLHNQRLNHKAITIFQLPLSHVYVICDGNYEVFWWIWKSCDFKKVLMIGD